MQTLFYLFIHTDVVLDEHAVSSNLRGGGVHVCIAIYDGQQRKLVALHICTVGWYVGKYSTGPLLLSLHTVHIMPNPLLPIFGDFLPDPQMPDRQSSLVHRSCSRLRYLPFVLYC